ncbi:MAG: 4-hydroxythreonine-4-phosphate dehydrogenase PdxA [Candidatus Tectomicrobia bacterium]|uniref:4-hydroxythreonine-4-phosphate dehydrogenase PdxA n=1 Tax=Tectimicrobiota bacterium TaxID=2528274 RepID=A0A933LQU9_UNCTE|nr:4-hydroxythreonine-4-phosphate dehydrogenase PdxA [Candidatus Tectomicrobia bacterium]
MIRNLPRIAITMGDPAGIGAEIIAKTLDRGSICRYCQPVVIGCAWLFQKTIHNLGLQVDFKIIDKIEEKLAEGNLFLVRRLLNPSFIMGQASKEGGKAALDYIEEGVTLAQSGFVEAIVTAPINKEAIKLAGSTFPGHTEFLAYLTGTKKFAMMLTSSKLRVVLVTTHVALTQVASLLTTEEIFDKILLSHDFLKRFGIKEPRVGVASLNPHGGEHGIFGREEEIIGPAVDKAVEEGIAVYGPLPADTLFYRALQGEFDVIVAMYHDQGLIPIKITSFGRAVNVTLGLPIIRTSVDHGTAYDIVGKGIADPGSLEEAVKLAAELVRRRTAL